MAISASNAGTTSSRTDLHAALNYLQIHGRLDDDEYWALWWVTDLNVAALELGLKCHHDKPKEERERNEALAQIIRDELVRWHYFRIQLNMKRGR